VKVGKCIDYDQSPKIAHHLTVEMKCGWILWANLGVEANMCMFFLSFTYIYMLQLKINSSRGEGDDLINRFSPPHICACLNLGPGFPRSYVNVNIENGTRKECKRTVGHGKGKYRFDVALSLNSPR
jgi:hypothetical protein